MKKLSVGKLFDNSLFVKILSVLFAIIVWAVITVVTNPNQEKKIKNVPVNLPLSDYAAGKLGLEAVTGADQEVEVTVNGKRYKVGNLTASDITVTADISDIKSAGTYKLKLTAAQKNSDSDYSVTSVSPSTVKVRFDYVVSAQVPLEAEASNVTAKDNYVKENAYASVETLEITGAQTDVEKVKRAVLVSDKKASVNNTLVINDPKLVLYDNDGNEVSQEAISYSPQDLQITVPVLKQKTINLTFGYKNVTDGFPIDELKYTMSKSTLKVMAPSDAVENIKELNIGYIDLRTVDIGSSFVLDIGLPSGFVNLENTKKVTVKFEKADLVSKAFDVSKFNIVNAPENYDVSVVTKAIGKVKIVGKKSIVNSLKPKDIVAVIGLDASNAITQSGDATVVVKITIPNKGLVWAIGEYSAVVNASAK